MVVALKLVRPRQDQARRRQHIPTSGSQRRNRRTLGSDQIDLQSGPTPSRQRSYSNKLRSTLSRTSTSSSWIQAKFKEEWKMRSRKPKKIIDKSIKVTATCVPVFVGHLESINIEFEDFLDEDEARDIPREDRVSAGQ
jgi:hypothetical protein